MTAEKVLKFRHLLEEHHLTVNYNKAFNNLF